MPLLDLQGLLGRVRKLIVPTYSDQDEKIPAMNDRGELLVSPALLPKTELARLGQTWNVKIATASAFTHVAALPTTRAELVLFNGEAAGGKSYVIDSVWHLGITSMAAAGSVALLGQIVPNATAPTDNTSQLITSRNGKTYNGYAKRAVAQTTMTADKWELLASSNSGGGATAQIGLATIAELNGGWILKPGDMLGVNVVAGTAAGTAIMGITWHEVQLPIG